MSAPQLSPAQRADLRAEAHLLKPVIIVGADGLTEPVIAETDRALNSHGLIKIRVFGDDRDHRLDVYRTLCDRLGAAPVQHIGKLLVIWRAKPAKPAATAPAAAPRAAKTRGASTRMPERSEAAPRGARSQLAGATRPGTSKSAPRAGAGIGPKTVKGGPRVVHVVKPTSNPMRRPKATPTVVLGNERVTAGGLVKRAKPRTGSVKRQRQTDK
ncbi:YhbY family RNA-binding protein [Chitinasiproducens palmae]|nr:YhbY family RNA-binding protein [Chitinasiproducens palmae]